MSIKHLNQKGFTLIEMMVVIAVISLLMLLIIPNAASILTSTTATSCEVLQSNINSLELTHGYTQDATLQEEITELKAQYATTCEKE